MCDNGDGTYHISYSPEEPGLYAVCVYVKGQHVQVAVLVRYALLLYILLLSKYLLQISLRVGSITWQLRHVSMICD